MANGSDPTRRRERPTPPDAMLSAAWLAAKLGVEPRSLDARRRAGELLGVPAGAGLDYVYPLWQFAPDGRPLPAVRRAIEAARAAGLTDADLDALLQRRHLTGGGRLLDALREGREEPVLAAIEAAAARRRNGA